MKIPKMLWAIPIVVIIAVTLNFVLENSSDQILISPQSRIQESEEPSNENVNDSSSNNLYSGPFAILDATYGVDDTVFLVGSGIPVNSKGEIEFIRPDGKIHHKLSFDGSKSAVNHYFTPVRSSDLEECKKCQFFGTWEISFRSDNGASYAPIYFEVLDSRN